MRKIFLLPLVLFLLPQLSLAVTVSPSYWYETWQIGQSNPQKEFTFYNPTNSSISVSLSANKNWIQLSSNSLTLQPNSTASLTVTLTPSGLSADFYSGTISYSADTSGEIGIFLTIQPNASNCRLIPLITDYITKIQADSPPFTKTFSVMVSRDCSGVINIQRPITLGTVQTTEGEKPISITGSLSLGPKAPGETATFDVEFNVKGMQPQTGNYKILVIGIDEQGNKIQTDINFQITILSSGEVPPEINITTLPSWEIPSSVQSGQTFNIVVRNVNPNLQPYVFPNEELFGEGVEISGNTYTFKFRTNITGKLTIKYTTLYKGAQIGKVYEKVISVTGIGTPQASEEMKFDFFPKPEEWKDGMNVSVLCRDKGNNNIVPCTIYLNGQELKGNVFPVEAGKTYYLSAVNPNYLTLDFNYTVPLPKILLYISPENPEVGDTITVTCKDEFTAETIDCSLNLDGNPIDSTFKALREGNHTLRASFDGYQTAEKTFEVGSAPLITYAPEKLNLNQNATIRISKPTSYTVTYKESPESPSEVIASGTSDKIIFLPQKPGTYYVYLKDTRVKTYEVKGFSLPIDLSGISIPSNYAIGIVGAAVLLFVLYILGKKRGKSTVTKLEV